MTTNEPKELMDVAMQIAAQCWCDEETKHLTMDPALATAFAKRLCRDMLARRMFVERIEAFKSPAPGLVPRSVLTPDMVLNIMMDCDYLASL